jgi:6-pyruvoyltetrahydropterin/6-carboxytetrahydropterin synthase
MSARLLHLAAAPFEAAVHIPVLAAEHPARRLHGHSFQARVRAAGARDADELAARLADVVAPLDHSLLNDTLEVPTDENLARWIRSRLGDEGVETVGVQSTRHTGVDLDRNGRAHLWRRFRFEAAHRLPNVPAGHPCGRMHGHGFEVVLHVDVDLGARDLGIDYERLGGLWQPLHARLHHGCLNEIAGLGNPTSELLARWIWERLRGELPELSWVSVHETATAGCHYDGRAFRIWKETRFESALAVPGVAAGRLHGHSYLTRLHLCAPLDTVLGWTIDYGDVRAAFTPVFHRLDHQRLDLSTVAEPDLAHLLRWLREACAPHLPALERIDLYDTPGTGAMLWWGERGPALPGLLP